ncbi:MAG: hypothetical protein ACLP1D_13585 [Xanthobacteraceae bacterium]
MYVVALIVVIVGLLACTPQIGTKPISPVDASDASPCDIADALTSARLIRDPSTGLAEKVPCP